MSEIVTIGSQVISAEDARLPLAIEFDSEKAVHAARAVADIALSKEGPLDGDCVLAFRMVVSELLGNVIRHVRPEDQANYDPEEDKATIGVLEISPIRGGRILISIFDRHPGSDDKVIAGIHADLDPLSTIEIDDMAILEAEEDEVGKDEADLNAFEFGRGLFIVGRLALWVTVHKVYGVNGLPTGKCITAEVAMVPSDENGDSTSGSLVPLQAPASKLERVA